MRAKLQFDMSEADQQIAEMSALLESTPEGLRQRAFDLVSGYIEHLGTDVVAGQDVATTQADGTIEVCCRLRLGGGFERLLSALRAGEVDILSHGGSLVG